MCINMRDLKCKLQLLSLAVIFNTIYKDNSNIFQCNDKVGLTI